MISPQALTELCEDLGAEATEEFLGAFLTMLDPRTERLRAALAAMDLDEATIAAMSLHSSCAMVGATDLARAAKDLLGLLRSGEVSDARERSTHLVTLAGATSVALHDVAHAARDRHCGGVSR